MDAETRTIRRDGREIIVSDSSDLSLPVSKRVGEYDELGAFVSAVASLPGVEVEYIVALDEAQERDGQ